MDRSSNSVKIEKIRRALEARDYDTALEIAKTVDSARIKSAADLSVVAEAYDKKGIYDTALVYYEQIYLKSRTRRILIHLINLCLKQSMADMAETYLRDFTEMAPRDFYRHIFRYRIDKMRGEDADVLIYDLEQLKAENFMEDWAYELAKLYHKSGQSEKCIAECNDIILWFGSGMYVDRARGLRAIHLNREGADGPDAGLAKEVRRLVAEGKSSEELENFIEEATMPEGNTRYSEEEYNQERFGEPVYDEEGRDVIWNTREFGAVTEEMIQQQSTMDLLQGMQVARQIQMKLGEEREMQVQEPEEAPFEETASGADTYGGEPEDEWTVFAPPKGREHSKKAAERPEAKEIRDGAVPVTKPERRSEQAVREKEAEEELYRLLEQEESEEELSKAIRRLTGLDETAASKENGSDTLQATKSFKLPAAAAGHFEESGAPAEGSAEPAEDADNPDGLQDAREADEEEVPEAKEQVLQTEEADPEADADSDAEAEEDTIYEYPEELIVDCGKEAPILDERLRKRGMKPEELFGDFLASANVRKQLFRCMEQILEGRNRSINIILTGEGKSGKTTLAKAIAKCTQVLGGMQSPRVAVIRGDKLNNISLEAKKEQLKASTMIVERASLISRERAAELLAMNSAFAGETAVILEDERGRMNTFLRENGELSRVYSNRIHLPKWTPDDLFLQALSMLYRNEYRMTETVAGQFLNQIRSRIEENPDGAYDAVCEYTSCVLKRAEKRMVQMLREFALDGEYKENDLTMLREEDL